MSGRAFRGVTWLGAAHGVNDAAAGWMLAVAGAQLPASTVVSLLLVYNALAFAGQAVTGPLTDRTGRARHAAVAGLGLVALALLLMPSTWWGAAIAAGCGSALFHVAGGALALASTPGRAAGPGLFAAPGVLGLCAGGALAIAGADLRWTLIVMLAVTAAIVWRATAAMAPGHVAAAANPADRREHVASSDAIGDAIEDAMRPAVAIVGGRQAQPHEGADLSVQGLRAAGARERPADESGLHEAVMFALLAGIALRSFLWTTVESFGAETLPWLLALGAAAACGKLFGGFLADAIGWRRWTIVASAIAAPLLVIGRWRPWCLLPGVALLQSTTPVGLAAAGQLLPRHPATAAGLVLGVGIAAGGVAPALGLVPAVETWSAIAWLLIAGALALAAGGLMGLAMPRARGALRGWIGRPASPVASPVASTLALVGGFAVLGALSLGAADVAVNRAPRPPASNDDMWIVAAITAVLVIIGALGVIYLARRSPRQ